MHVLTADLAGVDEWRERRDRFARSPIDERAAQLARLAGQTRRHIVRMIASAGQGHIGGDLSVTDILTTLFGAVLRIDPARPDWASRDRFILSKGHCAGALYATLAGCGYFPVSELTTFMAPMSALNGHPNRNKVPGVETNTGPLGHGMPVGVGAAVGAKLLASGSRTFVVVGDGELQEGSNWEALMTGAHQGLSDLTIVIDRNRLQQGARTEHTNGLDPLDAKLASFGWEVRVVDGHDYRQLLSAF